MLWNPIVQLKTDTVIFQIDLNNERDNTLRCLAHIVRLKLEDSMTATVRYRNKEKRVIEFNWNIKLTKYYFLNREAFGYPAEGWWSKKKESNYEAQNDVCR